MEKNEEKHDFNGVKREQNEQEPMPGGGRGWNEESLFAL